MCMVTGVIHCAKLADPQRAAGLTQTYRNAEAEWRIGYRAMRAMNASTFSASADPTIPAPLGAGIP